MIYTWGSLQPEQLLAEPADQWQVSQKVTSGRLGQVDFPSGQVPVAFHSQLPNGQGIRQVVCQLYH